MSVISNLLSRLRAGDSPDATGEALPSLDPSAVRQRMTPSDAAAESPSTPRSSYVLPLRSSSPSMASLPWQAESSDAEWKPVMLSDLEMAAIPTIPSLDALAEEGGISPTEPRFPFDT